MVLVADRLPGLCRHAGVGASDVGVQPGTPMHRDVRSIAMTGAETVEAVPLAARPGCHKENITYDENREFDWSNEPGCYALRSIYPAFGRDERVQPARNGR